MDLIKCKTKPFQKDVDFHVGLRGKVRKSHILCTILYKIYREQPSKNHAISLYDYNTKKFVGIIRTVGKDAELWAVHTPKLAGEVELVKILTVDIDLLIRDFYHDSMLLHSAFRLKEKRYISMMVEQENAEEATGTEVQKEAA